MATDASVLANGVVLSAAGLCAPEDMPLPGLSLLFATHVQCYCHGGCLLALFADLCHIFCGGPQCRHICFLCAGSPGCGLGSGPSSGSKWYAGPERHFIPAVWAESSSGEVFAWCLPAGCVVFLHFVFAHGDLGCYRT